MTGLPSATRSTRFTSPSSTTTTPKGIKPPTRPASKRVMTGLYAEDSITRRINRENILLLGGGRALLMQLAHPKVAAGVDEHSDFRRRPIQRLRRTVHMTMAIVFGERETALAAARMVNQTHAKVKGDGYRALDPELLLWVHATLVDSALVTYATFVQELTH